MVNNLYSWQILLTSSLGCFLGMFLSITVSSITQEQTKRANLACIWGKDAFLTSTAMGIFCGCCTLAIGSVDVGYLESIPLSHIFIYTFSLSLFAGMGDFWIKLFKLIFSRVSTLGNRN